MRQPLWTRFFSVTAWVLILLLAWVIIVTWTLWQWLEAHVQ